MTHRGKLIFLPPNRVWRTYPGGRTLDELAGAPVPADTHLAEDWIASTTQAVNRGREQLAEGVSQVCVGDAPATRDFARLLASDPEYFLGPVHVAKYGAQPQLLVKYLDSGTRLHFQVHPTREFARRVLGAPSGKTEAYYVLAGRDSAPAVHPSLPSSAGSDVAAETLVKAEPAGYIYVGFQRPPSRAQLREMILHQDELIGATQTDCFRVYRTTFRDSVVKDENSAVIAIVTRGAVTVSVGGCSHRLATYDKFFLPAQLGPVTFTPEPNAEILECLPPL